MIRRSVPALVLALVTLAPQANAQEGFERVVEGLDFAVNMAIARDGTIYVADKDVGEIRIVRDGELLDEPFARVETTAPVNEMGLLGVAVHPSFPDEPWVYAYYSDATDGRNHLARFRAEGDVAVERDDLLDLLPTTFGWHNGGDIAFGPDGKLYVAVGDGHDGSRSQDPDGLGGRILRLNPDGGVPQDNPFGPGNPTFALGIRNSFGLCFDPATGELWETENGPTSDDEVNLIVAGENYGWPVQQGPGGEPRFVDPVLNFPDTIVPTGCAVAEEGLLFGEGYSGNLRLMRLPGPDQRVVTRFEGGVTDVARAPDGAIWVVTPNALYRRAAPQPSPTGSARGTTAPSPSPGPDAPAAPRVGLVILGLIVAGLLLMRRRLLRR
jgi:quinoprotein glucose dehydrogenase